MGLTVFMDEIVSSDGDDMLSYAGYLSSFAVNVGASIVLSKVMGMSGLALGTMLSYVCYMAVVSIHFFKKSNTYRLRFWFSLRDLLLFSKHSLKVSYPAKMYAAEFNKLGKKASHGCIRLTVKDSRWIYKNCPRGTKIVIYNGKKAGPLGKPAMVKLPVKKKYSYDPTDKWYPKNPYNNKKPTIKGAKKKTIQQGDADYDILSGIKVKNSVGKNAKKLLQVTVKYRPDKKTPYEVTNAVDTDIAGYYKITYKIIDQLGRTAKVTVVHRVVKPKNDEDGGDVVSPPALSRLGTGMDMHLMNFDIYKEYIMEPESSGLFI